MRTLADLTPEERAQCRGMWCEDEDGFLFVYRGDHIGRDWLAVCAYPEDVHESYEPLDYITPRLDIPRAWQADGKPPAGEREEDYTDTYGCTLSTGQSIGMAPHTHIRRFVGDWEKA